MGKPTLQQRFIAALLARGEKEVKRTSRYVVFTCNNWRHVTTPNMFYYLGKAGALRVGHTKFSSFVVNLKHREELLGMEGGI